MGIYLFNLNDTLEVLGKAIWSSSVFHKYSKYLRLCWTEVLRLECKTGCPCG